MKKSQTLLLGSLLVFCGGLFLSWDYLMIMKDEVFSEMKILMMNSGGVVNEELITSAVLEDSSDKGNDNKIDYSIYYGVLEIPKIGLKRGFFNVDSPHNNINENVTMVDGSVMPDQDSGNLILMAHSGNAYISYFSQLYRLGVGDSCYVVYDGQAYHFEITNIYEVEKNGVANIDANQNVSTLVLITCTKDNDSLQTIYIAEEVG